MICAVCIRVNPQNQRYQCSIFCSAIETLSYTRIKIKQISFFYFAQLNKFANLRSLNSI